MPEIEIIDHLGDYWKFLIPARCEQQTNGFWKMWVYVAHGPKSLTEGAYNYMQIPLPIFTEWWE